ncbi:MAG: AAA family ATPase [Chloroflexi bacterium]|nr:AAA family ATPase [Chloroflexota bacterium]
MRNLNVLIGPNGSGKSNFLEMLALLRAAPTRLATPVKAMGGIAEWLWKGPEPSTEGLVETVVSGFETGTPIQHSLVIAEHGGRFEVAQESIGEVFTSHEVEGVELQYFYNYQRGNPILWSPDSEVRRIDRETLRPEESVLSQIRDPARYRALNWLETQYEDIHLFRNWSFGPTAYPRREQSTHARTDFLVDGGENLALVLSKMRPRVKAELIESIQELYEGIEDFYVDISAGNALLYLQEEGGRSIPASRLSDGTLRYLCLLAILLHPEPPPLIAIEEPELGLHPDIIPRVARLLVAASERTQLVVTTHSDTLVDALSSQPESVIVCEKENGESQFRRLDADQLKIWLEKYTLGQLWSMGEIGGNRW